MSIIGCILWSSFGFVAAGAAGGIVALTFAISGLHRVFSVLDLSSRYQAEAQHSCVTSIRLVTRDVGSILAIVIEDHTAIRQRQVGDEVMGTDHLLHREVGDRGVHVRDEMQ